MCLTRIHLFQTKAGEMHPLKPDELERLIAAGGTTGIDLAFVSACHSERTARALLQAGVKHVVAVKWDEKIQDTGISALLGGGKGHSRGRTDILIGREKTGEERGGNKSESTLSRAHSMFSPISTLVLSAAGCFAGHFYFALLVSSPL